MPSLTEITFGRNVGPGEISGAFVLDPVLETVNIPEDAVYYMSIDGAVYSSDGKTLEYVPSARTETLVIPEGVTTIADAALQDAKLDAVVFPDSLQRVEAHSIGQLDVAEFGENIVDIAENAFKQDFYYIEQNAGYVPNHLIVHGGMNGSYADTAADAGPTPGETAYFGEGMTRLSFANSGAPAILVVPSDLASLDLSGNAADPSAVTVYAPAGSAGAFVAARALEAIGADPSTQLKDYEELSVAVVLAGVPSQDGSVPVAAETSGGVDGAKEYRFVEVSADGAETVVRDWSGDASFAWTASSEGATIAAEVRDATMLSASSAADPEPDPDPDPAAPIIDVDLSAESTAGFVGDALPALIVGAHASDGAELSYQWYLNGEPIEGAVHSSYVPSSDIRGLSEYYVEVTATIGDKSETVRSETASIDLALFADEDLWLEGQPFFWAADFIEQAVDQGFMSGYEDGTHRFDPEGELTRGMVATILYRATVEDASDTIDPTKYADDQTGFSDAEDGMWFTAAINWANEAGIMTGDGGSNTIRPNAPISRAEIATMIERYARIVGGVDTASADRGAFEATTDWQELPESGFGFAENAFVWTADAGILTGSVNADGSLSLRAGDDVSRAQMAKIIVETMRVIAAEGQLEG